MKIVFFSDIHGNQYAFRAFQQEMALLKPDKVVFLGDVFGYYYGQEEILRKLKDSGYICLLGNHDRYFLELLEGKRDLSQLVHRYGSSYERCLSTIQADSVDFLKTLPDRWEETIDGLSLAAFHGSPEDPVHGRVYPDTPLEPARAYEAYDLVFLGHTHHKMRRQAGNALVINPGSLGQQRDGKGCSYAILDTQTGAVDIHVVEYPLELLSREIQEKDGGDPKLLNVLYRTPDYRAKKD